MVHETFDDPRLTAMGLFIEVFESVMARLDRIHAAQGLSGSDFDVLIRLARSPGRQLRMSDLAAQTSLSTSGITRVVDRLERADLACRRPSPDDRRSSVAVLTGTGAETLAADLPGLIDAIDRSFTGLLTPEQLDGFLDTLRTLRVAVRPGAAAGASVTDS